MAQTENQKKLLKILNEIFQLDQSDLDFGIYRIMNSKSKEIKKFLDKDLLSSVSSAFSSNTNSSLQTELDEAIQQAQALGADPEKLPKIIALREKLSSTTSSKTKENELFSHLANFFKRYYKDGDFVSLRRYKKDTYAIPYEGEEVKLHWANNDQYYIKSGEYFRDYTFTVDDKTIHFKLSDAQTESNNNKATSDKERRFVIVEENPCEVIKDELYINFEYKAVGKENQDKLNEKAISKALESIEELEFINALNTLAPTEKNKNRTIFEKHLKSYTSRNSFDYFIHKDLGGFLNRELDFYIKNEMLFLDDIMDNPIKYEEVMDKIKIFKEVAQKIIAFLTQLEELQKRLWEKKKFVIETNYCITLDKINENYYEEIFACDKQLSEWKELFDVDIQSIDALKEEKYLVLDTKFFDMKFKYKLLSEFDNLDEELDGVLINSENFGALNLLQSRYKEQVKTVYIDPPYNTGNDGFLYNDNYQDSSWFSLIYDRVNFSSFLLKKTGSIFSSIDNREQEYLKIILCDIFGKENFVETFLWTKTNTPPALSNKSRKTTEFIHCFEKNLSNIKYRGQLLDNGDAPLLNTGNLKKELVFPPNTIKVKIPDGTYSAGNYEKVVLVNDMIIENSIVVNEVSIIGEFKWQQSTLNDEIEKGTYFLIKSDKFSIRFQRADNNEYKTPNNKLEINLNKASGVGTNETAAKELIEFGINNFSYPKPTSLLDKILFFNSTNSDIVLDYFAGSGTTGHAVINLNREDKGKRKYILVEMGEYFDTVTKPRIQKVIYSDSWKDGKPTTKNGISQIFKYFKLESYEDTLNNLEFKKTKEQQATLDMYPSAKEEYMLHYSLDVESQSSLLNIDTFSTPFDYKLKIATSSVGETKETNIDLVETFNYLLGLVVEKIEFEDGFLTIKGKNLKETKILVIWRDNKTNDELDSFIKNIDLDSFDKVYINGDSNLEKAKLIEQEFKRLMFNE